MYQYIDVTLKGETVLQSEMIKTSAIKMSTSSKTVITPYPKNDNNCGMRIKKYILMKMNSVDQKREKC